MTPAEVKTAAKKAGVLMQDETDPGQLKIYNLLKGKHRRGEYRFNVSFAFTRDDRILESVVLVLENTELCRSLENSVHKSLGKYSSVDKNKDSTQ